MGGSIQRGDLSLSGAVASFAGPQAGSADGTGGEIRFSLPLGLATDGTRLFVADGTGSIRRFDIATAQATTLAGGPATGYLNGTGIEARFRRPQAVAAVGDALYVADYGNNCVRKVVPSTGAVSTVVDHISRPRAIASDGVNIYVNSELAIRRIVATTGETTTLAGGEWGWGTSDGVGSEATFSSITAMTTDGTTLFVADTNSLRMVDLATRVVTTIGRYAGQAQVKALAKSGDRLFFAASDTVQVMDLRTRVVEKLAGSMYATGSDDGPGDTALFNGITGLAFAGGAVYVTEGGNRTIRRIDIGSRTVATVAGTAAKGSINGAAATARFRSPQWVTTDGRNLYVSDHEDHTIRKISLSSGVVTTLAGASGHDWSEDGTGADASFYFPEGIVTDGKGLFVIDGGGTVRRIDIATRAVTTLAGNRNDYSGSDGVGTLASFHMPIGITTDGRSLYVTDYTAVRRIGIATGWVETLAGVQQELGVADGNGAEARFGNFLGGITTDGVNLYVADRNNNTIRQIALATGRVTTLAGNPDDQGSEDGPAREATFCLPTGITTDGTALFVTEGCSDTVRRVDLQTLLVTTVAGKAGEPGFHDDVGEAARFAAPFGITTDGKSLYVCDAGNASIRVLR